MTRVWLALGFLTRLPVPAVSASAAEFAAAIRCYPLVGIVIGLCVWGASWAGALVDPWTGALAGLAMWTGVTGALHLDGLADLADGLTSGHDRERSLAVMRRGDTGPAGAAAIVLALLLLGAVAVGLPAASHRPVPWFVAVMMILALVMIGGSFVQLRRALTGARAQGLTSSRGERGRTWTSG